MKENKYSRLPEKEAKLHKLADRAQLLLFIVILVAGIAEYWPYFHGDSEIDKSVYRIISEGGTPDLTLFVKRNDASNLAEMHTPQEVETIHQAAAVVRRICQPTSEETIYTPHLDFYFPDNQAARRCLDLLSESGQLPD